MISTSQHPSKGCPTLETLAECLDPVHALEGDVSSHLENCEQCQLTLQWIAGEAGWWAEATETLAVAQSASVTRIVQSVCPLSVPGNGDANDDPLCIHEVSQLGQLLDPACHPELIGSIGRYELEQLVGRGGMGLVFRAFDTDLQRVVAVKTLAVHLIPIGNARERFIREARACASLVHPHIVPVHDVITEGAVPAMVMQYIAGPTLERWLNDKGPMRWQEALRVSIQLTDALALAHENGLVHRDVKPGNVLLEAEGARALLTDFGLVRTLDDASLTHSGMLAGTPDYMSPEQASGKSVDARSDLFSLGSLLYAMLTGHPPFRANNPMAVMNRICHEPHRPVTEVREDVPIELSKLIDRLLEKEPDKRFSRAEEVRARLMELSRAQSHLRTTKPFRWTKWRIPVALACMLLVAFSAAAWLADVGKAPNRYMLAPPGISTPDSDLSANTETHPVGAEKSVFAELQLLDDLLFETLGDAERLLEEQPALPTTELRRDDSDWPEMDRELEQLKRDIWRLGNELRGL